MGLVLQRHQEVTLGDGAIEVPIMEYPKIKCRHPFFVSFCIYCINPF